MLWGLCTIRNHNKRWLADFKRARRDTNDAKHCERSNKAVTAENIKKSIKSF